MQKTVAVQLFARQIRLKCPPCSRGAQLRGSPTYFLEPGARTLQMTVPPHRSKPLNLAFLVESLVCVVFTGPDLWGWTTDQ